MKRFNWMVLTGVLLVVLSALLYGAHFLIFRDTYHIFIYMIGDLAFLPFEVLLVTLIIHRLLSARERRNRLQKLNMVIGAFFSEAGTELLAYLSDSDPDIEKKRDACIMSERWTGKEFDRVEKMIREFDYSIDIGAVRLDGLRNFLLGKREFLLRLLENPNLLEHESFAGLLRAVFHLTEELELRTECGELTEEDKKHMISDIQRVYRALVAEWMRYMKHLRSEYPFLFSFAVRTNPFDRNAA